MPTTEGRSVTPRGEGQEGARFQFPEPDSVALYWWRISAEDPWHLTLWDDVPEDIEETESLSRADYVPESHLSECESRIEAVRKNVKELQRRYERRETLHTSDFTAALLTTERGDRDGTD